MVNYHESFYEAQGYAFGREDCSHIPTYEPPDKSGVHEFAKAYVAGFEEFDNDRHYHMVNIRTAYDTWQRSQGESIFPAHCYHEHPHYFPRMTLVESIDGLFTGRVLSANAQGVKVRWHKTGLTTHIPQISIQRYTGK